ncbi:MAG TPA: L,D-transpeptidase [Acidiferrobacterales bacterium]|nr:L,D-transpeptidase [Acidiferrobacterales bacterium]
MARPTYRIEVDVPRQTLILRDMNDKTVLATPIATAKNGVGEVMHSERTPRGTHKIRAKIGAGMPANTVFVGRRPTGEFYSPQLRALFPERDWILTRILWLSGLEVGKNRLGNVDSMRRYIYIHGAPDEDPMGVPSSHGCIKMRNRDVIVLFDYVQVGTPVYIGAD